MSKIITRSEVKAHKDKKSLWIIIHDEVYDVTKFIEEHPGGEDTLLEAAGTDATDAFEDVGHSEDARELLHKYKIGKLPENEKSKTGAGKDCCRPNPTVIRTGSCPGRSTSESCRPKTPSCKNASPGGKISDKSSTSNISCKSSKTTRFVVPPDKCDEDPSATSAPKKIVCEDENSSLPRHRTKNKKTKGSKWKWLALATALVGAVVIGAAIYKKNS